VTLKTFLIALTAAAALIGAALLAVPSAGESVSMCLDLGKCLSF
jgi:hypothetical protein